MAAKRAAVKAVPTEMTVADVRVEMMESLLVEMLACQSAERTADMSARARACLRAASWVDETVA